MNVNVKIL